MKHFLLFCFAVGLLATPTTAAPSRSFFFVSSDIVVNKICDLIEARWQSHAAEFGPGVWGHIQQLYQEGLKATGHSRPRAIAWLLAGRNMAHATEEFLVNVFAGCMYATGVGELKVLLSMVSQWGTSMLHPYLMYYYISAHGLTHIHVFCMQAFALGGNLMVCRTFLAWKQANPAIMVVFSCVLPLALYPATLAGAVACLTNPFNMIIYSAAANAAAGWTWPPELWWHLPAAARDSIVKGWLASFHFLHIEEITKLANGLMLLPGRWIPGLSGPNGLLQSYMGENSVCVSDIAGLTEEMNYKDRSFATPGKSLTTATRRHCQQHD